MTVKRDLKRRVRDRQAQTGESYVTARRQVLGNHDAPARNDTIPVVELADATETGAALGFRCRVSVFPEVATEIDVPAALAHLRRILTETAGDPALDLMRGVVLNGERQKIPGSGRGRSLEDFVEVTKTFLQRARAGIGGVSESGHMLAVAGGGGLLMFVLSLTPAFVPADREPTLIVCRPDHMVGYLPLGGPIAPLAAQRR